MKRFLKQSVALVLTLAMTLGLLLGFFPLSASAAEDPSDWYGPTVKWYNNSGAADKKFYFVNLYLKDTDTGKVTRFAYRDVYNGGMVDFGNYIADYLLDNDLESAVFGYTWQYRLEGNSRIYGSDEPSHFTTFTVEDFFTISGESERNYVGYAGSSYTEHIDIKTFTGLQKFLNAGYSLEASYEAVVDGKTYSATGDHNNPPVFELNLTEDLVGKTFTVKAKVICREPAGRIVASCVRNTTVEVKRKVVDEIELLIRTPAAGNMPNYEIEFETGGVEPLADLDPDAFAGISNGMRWYDVTDSRYLKPDSDDRFQVGHQYKAYIYLGVSNPNAVFKMKNGNYDFGNNFSVNRKTDNVIVAPHTGLGDPSKALQIIVNYEALPARVIENIKVKNYTVKCYAGDLFQYEIEDRDSYFEPFAIDEYCKNGVRWYDKTDGRFIDPDAGELLQPGHQYEVDVFFHLLGGATFKTGANGQTEVTCDPTGEVLTVPGYDPSLYLCVRQQIDAGGTERHVYGANLVVKEPVVGMNPCYDVSVLTSNVELALGDNEKPRVSWYDLEGRFMTANDVFEVGHTYKMRVYLNAIDGFKFPFDKDGELLSKFHINGTNWTDFTYKLVDGTNYTQLQLWFEWEPLSESNDIQLKTNVPVPGFDAATYKPVLMEKPDYIIVRSASWRHTDGSAVTGSLRKGENYLARFVLEIRGAPADLVIGVNGQPVEYTLHPVDRVYIFDVPLVCQGGNPTGTEVVYTDDSLAQVDGALTVDLEATVELSDIAMEYYLDGGEFTYQWYMGSREIANANGPTLELTEEYADKRVYVVVSFRDDEYCIVGDPVVIEPLYKSDVTRLAGSHRWDTAIKVADEMKANLGVEKFSAIIIASGNDFADALAGSYLSTVKNAPILLSWGKGGAFEFLDTDNINYIKNNLAPGGTVYILGGMSAVPAIYEEALKSFTVKRLGGADRFETNLLILEEAGVEDGDEILVCTATNFADSLSASATGKPILLVFNAYGKLFGGQPDFLAGLKNCTFTVIGGESAVSAKLANAVKAYGNVTRLAGANRFETSVLVAEKYFQAPETAVLAYAWNYPDGLCGGSLAYSMKAPLILTMTKFEATAVAYATGESIKSGIVLGGDGLISDAAVRAIFAMEAGNEIVLKK